MLGGFIIIFVLCSVMKFYLSSYKFGNETKKLRGLIPRNNKKVAFIANALDYSNDLERRKKSEEENINGLKKLGFVPKTLDLRDYFGKKAKLEKEFKKYGSVFVRGGNAFVLRQAMRLSGLDEILKKLANSKKDFLYAGYSAGACVLTPSLKGLDLADDITQKPYKEQHQIIWSGLGLLGYLIVPHYKSDHKESKAINKVVEYCIENKILFKALRDGDTIIIK